MKKQVVILCTLFMSMRQFIAQTTPSEKIDAFIEQKGNDFEVAYEKKDVKAYMAEFIIHQLTDSAYSRQAPSISN